MQSLWPLGTHALFGGCRALEELTKLVQARVDGVRDVAMRQLDETGGREALESQQRSLKQSLRDYSQKSTFFDCEFMQPIHDIVSTFSG